MKQILSKRKKAVIYITLVILHFYIIFDVLINPVIDKLNKIDRAIENKKKLLERYSRLISKEKEILSLYEQYKEILTYNGKSEDIANDFLKEVNASAETFNLHIERITSLPQEEKGESQEVPLEVELIGSLSSIFQFINHLEKSPYFIKISSLRIIPQSRYGASSQLQCRITLSKVIF